MNQQETINSLLNSEWEYECLNIPKELQCPICLNLLTEPVTHSKCGNMFCNECIHKATKCPLCTKL